MGVPKPTEMTTPDLLQEEINRVLDYLYPALANEIKQLKTLMQG